MMRWSGRSAIASLETMILLGVAGTYVGSAPLERLVAQPECRESLSLALRNYEAAGVEQTSLSYIEFKLRGKRQFELPVPERICLRRVTLSQKDGIRRQS